MIHKQNKLKAIKNIITLTASTWEKDSHGLYDYQASKLTTKKFRLDAPCKIFRNWLTAQTLILSNQDAKKGKLPPQDFHFLTSLWKQSDSEGYSLGSPQSPPPIMRIPTQADQQITPINTGTYIVAKSLKLCEGKNQNLVPGDILKFGRVQFLVKQCSTHDNKNIAISFFEEEIGQYGVHKAQNIQGTCKFCLSDEVTEDNFLISPCKCKGSCESVHVGCLRQWIDSKVKKQSNGLSVTYNFTKFQCQICKIPFPKTVIKGSQVLNMLTIQKPSKPYIMLQSRGQRDQKNLHVIIGDENNNIKIGRGHQCQIRLTDISVSRMHAQIKYGPSGFHLMDNNSKFGTLIQLLNGITISNQLLLQCGRTTYSFCVDNQYPKTTQHII